MSRTTIIILAALILGFVGLIMLVPEKKETAKIGRQQASEGQQHLGSVGEQHAPYKSDPPASGPHAGPAPWGVSQVELPDENVIHNLEHGGIVINYQPSLPADKIEQLKTIAMNLTASDEQKDGKGFKVILASRAKSKNPVELRGWLWSHSLVDVDQATIQQFYRDHLNNAPEPSAR